MAKLPKLPHVKYVHRRGKVYAYFNTGQKRDGKAIYHAMPAPSAPGFFDSYTALLNGRNRRQTQAYTLAHMVDDYQRSPDFAGKADNTRKLYNAQLFKIVEAWGEFPVDDLEAQWVRAALDSALWKAGTRNMVLAVLGALYTWGRRRGKASIWPTKDIERGEGGTHAPWPQPVLEAALTSDDQTVRLAVHLLYFLGQRIGDTCNIRWNDIRGGVAYIRQQKTGKSVEVPVIAELRRELERTPKTGIQIITINSRLLRRKLSAFTLAHGAKTVPHGLRKNAVNALLEYGCTIAEVAAITGQTYQVVEHYAAAVNTRKLGKAAMLKFERGRRGTKRERETPLENISGNAAKTGG